MSIYAIAQQAAAQVAENAATAPQAASPSSQLLLIGGMAIIFYFIVIRPQQRRLKEHQQMVTALKRGDKIVTAGGVLGTVTRVDEKEETLEVEVATGVTVKVLRSTVNNVVAKPQPAANDDNKKTRRKTVAK